MSAKTKTEQHVGTVPSETQTESVRSDADGVWKGGVREERLSKHCGFVEGENRLKVLEGIHSLADFYSIWL